MPGIDQTLAQTLDRADFFIVRLSTRQRVQHSRINQEQTDDDRDKTERVQQKKWRDAEEGDEHTTKTWPQHTSHVDERRVERDGIR